MRRRGSAGGSQTRLTEAFLLLSLLFPGGLSEAAHASTYFVAAAAKDDSGNGSATDPKKFVTSGVRLLQAGDTLVLRDGTYAGQNNMIGDYASPRVWPPSGSPGHPTTIRAEHVGGAIIDAGYTLVAFSSVNKSGPTTDYLRIDGIHFRHGGAGVFNIKGTGNKISNCGFEDGMAPDSAKELPIAYVAGGSSHTLVEDCWVWGKGRYGFYTSSTDGGTHHVIFRRVVVRLDNSPPFMTAGLRFYNAHDNVMENCIVLDSHIDPQAGEPAAFTQGGGNSYGDPDNAWLGVLALNNPQMWGYNANDVLKTETVTDSVFWGNHDGVFMTPQDTVDADSRVNLKSLTIGANAVYAVRHNSNYAYKLHLSDSLVQVPRGATAFKEPSSVVNCVLFLPDGGGSAGGYSGSLTISHKRNAAALKYLPRVEPGSELAKARMGATLLYRIGESGTLCGEPGWDGVTGKPLWPFANEALWSARMKAYTASGPGGDRGFASLGGSTPLSDYVWGYLGHPAPPFNLAAVAGEREVTLHWSGKEHPDLVGYRLYGGSAPGRYDLPGYSAGKRLGTATSATVTGLAAGRSYYFAVTAVDRKKGESGVAYEVSVAIAP